MDQLRVKPGLNLLINRPAFPGLRYFLKFDENLDPQAA